MKWNVVDGSGVALASQAVTLIANKGYSGSNATFTSGVTAIPATNAGTDSGLISGTTDANGDVSFILTDTSATGEPSSTSTTVKDPLNGAEGAVFGQFALQVGDTAQGVQSMDIVDVHVINAASGATPTLVTFESGDTTGYALGGDTDFGGNTSSLSSTPPDGGSSGSLKSAKIVRGNQTWSGTTFLNSKTAGITLASASHKTVTMNVYAPVAAKQVLLKLEDADDVTHTVEAYATSTTVVGWQTMTFNLAAPRSGTAAFDEAFTFNKASIFVDYVTAGSFGKGDIYYFDDVAFNGATTPALVPGGGSGGGGGGGGTPAVPVAHRLVPGGSTGLLGTPFDKGAQGWFEYYSAGVKYYTALAQVGSTVTLKWHVTNTSGAAFANQPVNLLVGKAYSLSTASFSTTYSGHASWNTTGHGDSNAQIISGTTDANGDVSWTLTNTDLVGEGRPDNLNGTVPNGGLFAQITLLLPGGDQGAEDQDIIDLHFVAALEYVPLPSFEENPKYFEATVKPDAKLNTTAGTFTCYNGSGSVAPTLAAYYLLVDRLPVAGLRYGKFESTKPLYPFINALADGSTTATSATFTLDKEWNANGHTARLECVIQTGTSFNTQMLKAPAVQLQGVGKYKRFVPFAAAKPSKVTMRLVEPVLKKDAAGKPVDYVDMSASPIKDDNWGKYYGSADGGLGVFYKYLDAGSTTTFKYKVTDSVTKKAVPYYKVWLVVNKNYGGSELASFTYENNGVINVAAPNPGPVGETQFEGRTDINGYVSFTLVNTNTVAQAEPKPAALNAEQPKTVSTIIYSTITLMARLGEDETKETKDFVWAHIVKP